MPFFAKAIHMKLAKMQIPMDSVWLFILGLCSNNRSLRFSVRDFGCEPFCCITKRSTDNNVRTPFIVKRGACSRQFSLIRFFYGSNQGTAR